MKGDVGVGPGVRRRTERGVGGVQKQWEKIHKGVSEFGSHYMAVKRMKLTGNPSDEDMISAAMARFCGANCRGDTQGPHGGQGQGQGDQAQGQASALPVGPVLAGATSRRLVQRGCRGRRSRQRRRRCRISRRLSRRPLDKRL